MVAHALSAFRHSARIDEIVLVVRPEDVERARALVTAGPGNKAEKVVCGGATRQASVRSGLVEISEAMDLIAVHDAARPFVTCELIDACLDAAASTGAAAAALPVSDTIKRADSQGRVEETLDRSRLWAMQTPQVFDRELLCRAYAEAERAGIEATDDCALVERLGHPVALVPGDERNIKITTAADLEAAERRLEPQVRTGFGYDLHRLQRGRRLVLGGVEMPHESGLVGHSDADVVAHAACDAVLGAVGLGDIGRHFPDSDERYAGISSMILLEDVGRRAKGAGYRVTNLDVVVVAERPRISGVAEQMGQNLAGALQIEAGRVNIKATTTEGLGPVGTSRAIACYAVATVMRTGLERAVGR